MTRMQARMLPDGLRLHLSDGPIDLIISAEGTSAHVELAYGLAQQRFETILDELCAELTLLRAPTDRNPQGRVAQRMWSATCGHAVNAFITPMAAVAGAVAEEVLAAMTSSVPLGRAYVNNGGDIAFHLAPPHHFQVGLIDNPEQPSLFAQARIAWSDPVRGIATSGWRGRSFSFGIADAVTVLAASASAADAAATMIANAVDLPGHRAILRVPATDLQPDSDLGTRRVTQGVGILSPYEVTAALDRGVRLAQIMIDNAAIAACALHLQGVTRNVEAQQDRRTAHHASGQGQKIHRHR